MEGTNLLSLREEMIIINLFKRLRGAAISMVSIVDSTCSGISITKTETGYQMNMAR